VRVDPGSVTFVLAEDSCYGVPAIEAFEASKSAALPKHERRIAASWTSTSIRTMPCSLRSNNSSMRRGRTAVPPGWVDAPPPRGDTPTVFENL
jgi:hypothetical protein